MPDVHPHAEGQRTAPQSQAAQGSGPASRTECNPHLKEGLCRLWEGYVYACELRRDKREFAVEIEVLRAAGMNNNDLRWLIGKGYVQHAAQKTSEGKLRRLEHREGRLALRKGSCFLLTDAGVEFAKEVLALPAPISAISAPKAQREGGQDIESDVPYWNAEMHTLYWQGKTVKHFKHEAPFQEAILEAFQSCRWSRYAVVALSKEEGVNPKERLRITIKNLNRSCGGKLRFTQEGNGDRVGWEPGA
jgi:hypothetical protein